MINANKPHIPDSVILAYKLAAIKAVFESQNHKLPDNAANLLMAETGYGDCHTKFCSELSYVATHTMTINQIQKWVEFLEKRIPVLETEVHSLLKDYIRVYNLSEETFKQDFLHKEFIF